MSNAYITPCWTGASSPGGILVHCGKNPEALLIIDMLNDFVLEGAPLEVSSAREILPNIKREIDKARSEGIPVVYVSDAHDPDDREFNIWPHHCVKGSKGAMVVDDIKPQEGDIVIEKKTYSGFFKTELDEKLKTLGVTELTITGCVTNICIMYTASDAVLRGYKVTVPKNCSAGLDPDDHEFAFRQMGNVLKVDIV